MNKGRNIRAAALPVALLALVAGLGASDAFTVKLQSGTVQAWNSYLQWADAKVQREISAPGTFLIEDSLPAQKAAEIRRSLAAGDIVVERRSGVIPAGAKFEPDAGTIHHWWGVILVADVKMGSMLEFLQDYNHHAGRFPDVEQSRIISRDGQHFKVFLRVRRAAAMVTAYYNTEQDCVYRQLDPTRVFSSSNAVRIAELADPGTPREREKPPGEDRGFLWRLASWWRIQETDRGVVVELESASLSRDIPLFVKFIPGVTSYINSVPKDSIRSILASIRTATAAGSRR